MSSSNYSQPSVSLQKPNGQPPNLPPTDEYGGLLPQLLVEPRMCQAGWGISWITKAFAIFKDQFLLWLAIGVVYLIIAMIGSSVPVINFIFPFLPVNVPVFGHCCGAAIGSDDPYSGD